MANYRIKSTGESVKLGDIISTIKEKKTTFGIIKSSETVLLTEETLPLFITNGIIEEIKPTDNTPINLVINEDITYYVNKLAKQFNTDTDKMSDILDNMNKVCPTATLSLLLRTISDEYCKVEGKRISNHKNYYWYISTTDGSVNRLEKAPIDWNHITLFKEKKYALNAKLILKEQFTFMYGK